MSDTASVPGPQCAHERVVIGLERTGDRFAQRVWFVERCIDCTHETGRRKATREVFGGDRRVAGE
jgi:hypothetical protein